MKILKLLLALCILNLNAFCQDQRNFDSAKFEIINHILKKVKRDFFNTMSTSSSKYVIVADIKQLYIHGQDDDGQKSSVKQDSIYSHDTSRSAILDTLLNSTFNEKISKISFHSMGIVNENNYIKNHIYFREFPQKCQPYEYIYLKVSEPIAGWDNLEELYRNFVSRIFERRYDLETKINCYFPIKMAYVDYTNKLVMKQFLYTFSVEFTKDKFIDVKYLNQIKLFNIISNKWKDY